MDVSNSSGTTSVSQYLFFQYILEENQHSKHYLPSIAFLPHAIHKFHSPQRDSVPKPSSSQTYKHHHAYFLPLCFSDCSFGFFLLGVAIRENQPDTHFLVSKFRYQASKHQPKLQGQILQKHPTSSLIPPLKMAAQGLP